MNRSQSLSNVGRRYNRRGFMQSVARGAVGATLLGGLGTLRPSAAQGAEPGPLFHPAVTGEGGVVAAINHYAGEIGVSVLRDGGNAVDAAVAMLFAVAVTEPWFSGLGGGVFIVCRGSGGDVAALDAYSEAPAAIREDSFADSGMHREGIGHRVVAVPGLVAGAAAAHGALGSLPWARLVAPAAVLARDGFVVNDEFAFFTPIAGIRMLVYEETRNTFLFEGAAPYPPGSTFRNPDLANTLDLIADEGPEAFYTGLIAELIADEMARAEEDARDNLVLQAAFAGEANDKGFLTLDDLAAYRPRWRAPLMTNYRGHEVFTMGPPAGGIAVLEMLNLLEGFDLAAFGELSADHLHVLAEVQKLALADAQDFIADPEFVDVPADVLASKGYAKKRREAIDPRQARPFIVAHEPVWWTGCEEESDTTSAALDEPAGRLTLTGIKADGTEHAGKCVLDIRPAGHVRVNLDTRQYNLQEKQR